MLNLSFELLVLALALLGWGELVAERVIGALGRPFALSGRLLFGMYVFAIAGQVAPLLGPYAYYTGVFLRISGVVLFVWLSVPNWSWQRGLGIATFLVLFLVSSLALSQGISLSYDAGLYHLPFIRWIAEVGSVPGLANLHSRFGFNSTWLTSAALFSASPDFAHGVFVWSIAATLLLYGGLVTKGLQALSRGQNICGNFCLIAAALLLVLPDTSFQLLTNTDISTALLVLHAIASFIALGEVCDRSPERRSEELLSLACAIPLALTSKLSSGPLVALMVPLIPSLLRDQRGGTLVLVGLLLPTVWVIENLVLSGCVAYPIAPTCFDLPWAIDPAAAQNEVEWVTSWARVPERDPDDPIFVGYSWLKPWSIAHWQLFRILAKILASAIALIVAGAMLRLRLTGTRVIAWPMAVVTLGIVYWFLVAPDPRFGAGFVIAFASLALALPLSWFPRWVTGVFFVVGLLDVNLPQLVQPHGNIPLSRPLELPQPMLNARKTAHGLWIKLPEGNTGQCWLAVPPCAPYFNESLARQRFWLRDGFAIPCYNSNSHEVARDELDRWSSHSQGNSLYGDRHVMPRFLSVGKTVAAE